MDLQCSAQETASSPRTRPRKKSKKWERLLEWKEMKGIGPGLKNLGNTCFINSSLQCLLYTPPIQNFRHMCAQDFCPLLALQRLAEAPSGVAVPEEIINRLKSFGRQFRRGQQEDAHEFLRCLIDKIHERKFVRTIFCGILRSIVKCLHCSHHSKTFDPFLDLSLALTSSDVAECLKKFCGVEALSESEYYYCSRCDQRVPSTKELTIKRAPLILTLHLKRFSNDGKKDNRTVTFPDTIELPVMPMRSITQMVYSLYAILVHDGYASRSGHYYSYVQTASGQWHEVNDAVTSPRTKEQAMSQGGAYILFYKKLPSACHSDPFSVLLGTDGRSLCANPADSGEPDENFDLAPEARILFPPPNVNSLLS